MFRGFRKGDDPKRDKPVFELGANNIGGEAKVEWKAIDVRDAEDKSELEYIVIVSTPRAAEKEGDLIPLKNPQVVEMKWERPILYYSDAAKLHIKTFEVAKLAPEVTIKLQYKKDHGDISCVFEKTVVIDTDKTEISVELELSEEMLEILNEQQQIALSTILTCKTMPLEAGECGELLLLPRTVLE